MAKPKKEGYGNIFVGFMFLGMGVGWLLGHAAAGLLIGLGLGFIAQDFLERREAQEEDSAETGAAAEPGAEEDAASAAASTELMKRAQGASAPDIEEVWKRIEAHQGETFQQVMGQTFTYTVEGNAVVPSTTNVKIQKSQFAKALPYVPFEKVSDVPKDVFGPSYVYAILMDERIRNGDW